MTAKRNGSTLPRAGRLHQRLLVSAVVLGAAALLPIARAAAGQESPAATQAIQQREFATPAEASEALIDASERFDVEALTQILGSGGIDLVITADPVLDRNTSAAFAEQARLQTRVEIDPENPTVAIVSVGPEQWPLPIPIVKEAGTWHFDTEAGREEVLFRRIGRNELTAIDVCLGYVEAQHEYALQQHPGMRVNQYAQRIISTAGTRDGLAWEDDNGAWQGPVGEAVAQAIAAGYGAQQQPFHGYLFKVLKGQGPAAPLGELDFVLAGAMIGGFALVAAPADYGVNGVKTFIVSHDGVVFEKDLGPTTLEQFQAMERFDPDDSWELVVIE